MKNTVLNLIRALPNDFPGLNALDRNILYLMGCMKFDQFCCTWRAIENPVRFCPFCPAELKRRGRNPLAFTQSWALFTNEFPRDDVENMLLITPHRHVVDPRMLSENDMWDVGLLFREVIHLHVPDGALVTRFGDPKYHAGTIPHLHANIIRPTPEGGCFLPVAKTFEEHRADYARTFDFVKQIDERGGVEWLFSTEGVVETHPPTMA